MRPVRPLLSTKKDADRFHIYLQGVNHRHLGLSVQWKSHEYIDDYMDGYKGNGFDLLRRKSFIKRLLSFFTKS